MMAGIPTPPPAPHPRSGMVPWPADWPRYVNGGNHHCDMLLGPCSCGGWHQADEFELIDGVLYRYGRPAAGRPGGCHHVSECRIEDDDKNKESS